MSDETLEKSGRMFRRTLIVVCHVLVLYNASVLVAESTQSQRTDEKVRDSSQRRVLRPITIIPCGPSAAYILLRIMGKEASLDQLSDETRVDAEGRASVATLARALEKRGVYARGRRLKFAELKTLEYPAIVLLKTQRAKENHFVVYLGAQDGLIGIVDPLGVLGARPVPEEEFLRRWQGIAVVTQMGPFADNGIRRFAPWFLLLGGGTLLVYVGYLAWRRWDKGFGKRALAKKGFRSGIVESEC